MSTTTTTTKRRIHKEDKFLPSDSESYEDIPLTQKKNKRVKQTARMSVIPNAISHPLVQRLVNDKIIFVSQAQGLIKYMKENKMDLDYETELAYDDKNQLILAHSENCRTCCCCHQRTIDFIEMEDSHFKCWTCADKDLRREEEEEE